MAFPVLKTARRQYQAVDEAQLFDLRRVDAELVDWRRRRTFDSTRQISLANRNYRLGSQYHGQCITVQFDPPTRIR